MWTLGTLVKEMCLVFFVFFKVCFCCIFARLVKVRKGDIRYAEGVSGEGLQLGKC